LFWCSQSCLCACACAGAQVDNFKLEGTAATGAAVTPCPGDSLVQAGRPLTSSPCDYPNAATTWSLDATSGALSIVSGDGHLCLGVSGGGGSAGSNVSLVKCGADGGAFAYDSQTGRISPTDDASVCVTAVQRGQHDATLPTLAVSACSPAPSWTQQFQFNPQTGALRPKSPSCVAEYVAHPVLS